jgi:hypothetical protein
MPFSSVKLAVGAAERGVGAGQLRNGIGRGHLLTENVDKKRKRVRPGAPFLADFCSKLVTLWPANRPA